MNKATAKRMFTAIEHGDLGTLAPILDSHPEAVETVGEHNRYVRDKTPLMFAMQCDNLPLAHVLLDRGANAAAEMSGGPGSTVLLLCMTFAYSNPKKFDDWVRLASRLIDEGADPNTGLYPALRNFGHVVTRADLIRLTLDRGADPNRQVGDSGNTVRELVEINRHRYSAEVLGLFGIA